MDRGDIAGALKIVEDALKTAGTSDAELVWRLRVWRATLLITTRLDEAASILAQPLPPHVRNSEAGARHLFARYMLSYYKGSRDPALLQRAREVAAVHAPNVLPEILMVFGEAEARQAVALARKMKDESLAAKAEANLVNLYASSGRYAEAIKIGEPLLPKLERLQLLRAAKDTAGNLGWAYSEIGDYDQATERLSFAISKSRDMGDYANLSIWIAALNNVRSIRRDWNGVIHDSGVVISETAKDAQAARGWAFSSLARAHLELGRFDDARTAVRQALALEHGESALVTRIVEARIQMKARDYDAAKKTLSAVLGAKPKPETQLEALGQLAQLHALTNRNAEAEKTFKQAVGLVQQARKSVDSRLRITVYNTASELFDNYIDFLVRNDRHEEALRVTETSRAQTLAERLAVTSAANLDPRKIARQRNAVILCYWLGRSRSYVWTVTPANVKLTTIPQNDTAIEQTVETYRARLVTTDGTLQESGATGTKLFETLVPAEVQAMRGGARIIVIPDGRLHTLNFETLVVPGKTPRYWIEDAVISNASSLQLLARGTRPAGKTPRMLLVGNPRKADDAFPPLRKAGDEIKRIRDQFGARATVLAEEGATPAAYFEAKPQQFDIVHFVAHGVPSRIRPLDSAVILSPDGDRNYRLLAGKIAEHPLTARLVTISSCHGAGTTTYAGEGLVGLAWAFLYAGAQQVVAALWAVQDSAAPELMEHMYAGIRGGKDPAVALRDAKLRLLHADNAHKHAKFWAPFIIYV